MRIEEVLNEASVQLSPNGLGNLADNKDVDHLGMRMWIKPSTYLQLAARINPYEKEHLESIRYIYKKITEENEPIGNPILKVVTPDISDSGLFEVDGHEGRHRAYAIAKANNDQPIEVHIIFLRGRRNRHIQQWWLDKLKQKKLMISEDGKWVNVQVERIET